MQVVAATHRGAPSGSAHHPDVLQAFYRTHLVGDRALLMTMRARLDRTGADALPLYEPLLRTARRMAAAATLFEADDVGRIATTLEEAVLCARVRQTPTTRIGVRTALNALVDLLQRLQE